MKRVLFICTHNSARSQIAEELLKKYGSAEYAPESAGLEPGQINPYVAQVLQNEEGIDISAKKTRSVFDVLKEGHVFWEVVAVCGRETNDKCPIFPGVQHRYHWDYPDPSIYTGSDEEIIARVTELYRVIKQKVIEHFGLET